MGGHDSQKPEERECFKGPLLGKVLRTPGRGGAGKEGLSHSPASSSCLGQSWSLINLDGGMDE